VIGATSEIMMNQIKSWIDEEVTSLRQQLDLLEMARWNLSSERGELEDLERKIEKTKFDLENVKQQLQNAPSEQDPSELVEKYIATIGQYLRNMVKLSMLMEKIDRRSNDLLTYRDSLVDLLVEYGKERTRQQTSS
jgi:hypothetical protein